MPDSAVVETGRRTLQSLVLLSIAGTDRVNILMVALLVFALGDQNKASALFLQE